VLPNFHDGEPSHGLEIMPWQKVHDVALGQKCPDSVQRRWKSTADRTGKGILRDGAVMNDDWVDFLVLKILLPLTAALLVVFLGFLVIGLVVAISGHELPEQRMYRHCIEDGNTDYYCYHMTQTLGGKYD